MALSPIGQTSVQMFSDFAMPGQLADLAYAEIASYPAAETIQPGRSVELASDGLSVQQVQQTSSTFNPIGVAILQTARAGSGAVGVTAYGVGGIQYILGEEVPVLLRGRIYAEWKGTTQTAGGMPNVYHSSTLSADRGKFTDAGTSTGAGTEISNAGHQFRIRQALAGTGNIVLLDVNLPGAA
jgi:hypothetical protein